MRQAAKHLEKTMIYNPTPTQFAADYCDISTWIMEAARLVESGAASEELADAFAAYQAASIESEDATEETMRLADELREAAEDAGIDTSED